MKKRKISLIIIALAMAFCMALCIVLPACSGGGDDNKDTGSEHTHTYDVLKYDEDYHWYECSCGEASPDDPVAHSSENGYKYDDDSHWLVCDVCGQKFGTEAHDVTSGTCVCGYVPEVHTHVYDVLKSDETGHWYECSCGEGGTSGFAAHDSAAYDSDENQHWTICSVCNFVTGTAENHSSDGVTWTYDKTYHWHECVCGAQLDKTEHTLTDGKCSCGYEKADLTSTTIYMVGDSTMCSFTDTYYIPRYGYGTQLANYLTDETGEDDKPLVTVENLAWSGRSSVTYITDSQSSVWYNQMVSNISAGDYLIIGFGHNDEKSGDTFTDPNIPYGTDTDGLADGFKDNLYNNYVKVALDKGATPILCTPIVRYNESANYEGSSAHITSDGNYTQAIIDLGQTTGTQVIDLTALTKADYLADNDAAQWYHSFTTAKATTDENAPMARNIATTESTEDETKYQLVVPDGRDDTHLNMYGAKMVAYEFVEALAQTDCSLADYIADECTQPSLETDFEDAFNPDYLYKPYNAFDPQTDASTAYTGLPDGWYGTYFGDLASNHVISYDAAQSTGEGLGVFTVGSTADSKGKIEGADDQIVAAFMQLSRYQNFEITATVTVTEDLNTEDGKTGHSQTAFGIMLRDDIYIDVKDTSICSNYVTAGILGNSGTSYANFYRLDTSSKKDSTLPAPYAKGDVFEMKIVRENETVTCTVTPQGGSAVTNVRTDISYYGVDPDYVYLCLFATRGVTCTFDNVVYNATGLNTGA